MAASAIRDITQLSPVMQRGAAEFLKRCQAAGLPVLITETYRTPERQKELYAQGRTAPGAVVTWTTTSPHMYRCAFDICRNIKGQEWDDSDNFYAKCGAIWQGMGGVWGGSWTPQDKPHMEFTDGKQYSWFAAGNKLPDTTRMKWETAESPALTKDDVTKAIAVLVQRGIIASPDYWAANYGKLQYLDRLIVNMANWK
ncbi:MAG: M15 family metallopeptidase [Defluviitaleaceae bacterium]|nr:M15 family metallopeptidase [Defluviitaleaceae bacterium]